MCKCADTKIHVVQLKTISNKLYLSVTLQIFTFEVLCKLSTGYTSENLERVGSVTNFETISLQNMWTWINDEKTCGMELIYR